MVLVNTIEDSVRSEVDCGDFSQVDGRKEEKRRAGVVNLYVNPSLWGRSLRVQNYRIHLHDALAFLSIPNADSSFSSTLRR